jgi:AraC-like DNA-binding protein
MEKQIEKYEIKINSAGKTYCTPDWYWETKSLNWNDYDLWTVIGGEGELKTPEGNYNLVSGDCFILRSDERYLGTHNPKNPLVVIHIHFNFIDNNDNIIDLQNPPVLYRRINKLSFFKELLERVLNNYQNGNIKIAHKWLQVALIEICKQDSEANLTGLELEQKTLIEKICNQIKQNPANYHGVEEITAKLSYSKDHFIKIFKKYEKQTPYEFILESKMEKARTLLLSSSHSIGRIAQILGYHDIYHFSKQFKKRNGVSPSKYRKG